MDLIIRATDRCNFDCAFCHASKKHVDHLETVPPALERLIAEEKPARVIVTGGEPLTLPDTFWDRLLEIYPGDISFSSNMYLLWKDPEKYRRLVTDRRVFASSSFQYGNDRRFGGAVFTEGMFREVNRIFQDMTGSPLFFISVVNEGNFQYCMKTVELARELGTCCRLNPQMGIGSASSNFPLWRMLPVYLNIIESGLEEYEYTCKVRDGGGCPFNTYMKCGKEIRTVWFSGGEMREGVCDMGVSKDSGRSCAEHWLLKPECAWCRMKNLCNNCQLQKESILDIGLDIHCQEVKKLEASLVKYSFYI